VEADQWPDLTPTERDLLAAAQADYTARILAALEPPTHAALLAAALKLPEVAALVAVAQSVRGWRYDPPISVDSACFERLRTALTALEAKP
jgi:hypothetical protein